MIIILATMSQLIMKMRIVVLTRVTKMKRLLSKRKKLLKKNVTKPPLKTNRKTKRYHRLYKQLVILKYFIC